MLKDGSMDVDKTIKSQGNISDQMDAKIKKLAPQAKMADKYPNDKSLQDIKNGYNKAVKNKKEADELLEVAMDFKSKQLAKTGSKKKENEG